MNLPCLHTPTSPVGSTELLNLFDANDPRNLWRLRPAANDNLPLDPLVPIVGGAMAEAAFVTLVATAFLLPIGLTAARFLDDPQKYLNKRLAICGSGEKSPQESLPEFKRGAWILFPRHDVATSLTPEDCKKIIEFLYPDNRRDMNPDALGGRPFAMPGDPPRDDSDVLPWTLRNSIWNLPRPNSQPATERTLSGLEMDDRGRKNPLEYWGSRIQAGEGEAPHERFAARDFLESRKRGSTEVVNGAEKPKRQMDPAIQRVLELGYRRRHVAKVVSDTRKIVIGVMKNRRPIFIQDLYDLKIFHSEVDPLSLADIFLEIPLDDLRTLDGAKTRHAFVRRATDLLVIHRKSLTDALKESTHDIVHTMTQFSDLLGGEYQDVGNLPVPELPEFKMQSGGEGDRDVVQSSRHLIELGLMVDDQIIVGNSVVDLNKTALDLVLAHDGALQKEAMDLYVSTVRSGYLSVADVEAGLRTILTSLSDGSPRTQLTVLMGMDHLMPWTVKLSADMESALGPIAEKTSLEGVAALLLLEELRDRLRVSVPNGGTSWPKLLEKYAQSVPLTDSVRYYLGRLGARSEEWLDPLTDVGEGWKRKFHNSNYLALEKIGRTQKEHEAALRSLVAAISSPTDQLGFRVRLEQAMTSNRSVVRRETASIIRSEMLGYGDDTFRALRDADYIHAAGSASADEQFDLRNGNVNLDLPYRQGWSVQFDERNLRYWHQEFTRPQLLMIELPKDTRRLVMMNELEHIVRETSPRESEYRSMLQDMVGTVERWAVEPVGLVTSRARTTLQTIREINLVRRSQL